MRSSGLPNLLRIAGMSVAMLCTSCAGLKQPFPNKAYFSIDPGTPGRGASTIVPSTSPLADPPVILVRRFSVASPYDEPLMIYKTGPDKFEADYYNAFIAEPASLLTEDLLKWYSGETSAGYFVPGGSGARHDLTLECNITSLEADLQIKNAASAVIEGRFMLIDNRKHDAIVFDKTYSMTAPAASAQPHDLAAAWGVAYKKLLQSLTNDLEKQRD